MDRPLNEPLEVAFGTGVAGLLTFARPAVGIVMIWQCFVIKDIIEDHVAPADAGLQPMFVERVTFSGLATFFFSIFYRVEERMNCILESWRNLYGECV